MRRRVLLILSLLLPALCGQAAPVIRHIGTGNGLPNSFVLDLAVDDRGMVWAATEDGLARIAGDSFTVWNTDNSKILDNKIIQLFFEPGSHSLWCQTMNYGFSILDSHTAEFSVFNESNGLLSNALNGVFPAQDGGVWITTKSAGLQHYDPMTHESRYYTPDNCSGLEADIRCCAEDRYGHLYLGYNRHGFAILDLETCTVRNYAHDPGNPSSLPGDLVRSILIDSAGTVWVGTNQGLGVFDRMNGTFRNYRHNGKDDRSLAGDNIMGLAEMADHTLWVSSDLGGISILDLRDDAHTAGFRRITDEDGLSSINIRCTLQDGYGNVWVANYASGVDFITDNATPFNILPFYRESGPVRQLKRVYAICSDADGNLWLGGENELSLFRDGRLVRSWDLSPYLVQTYTIPYALLSDRAGNIWIGLNDEGVLKFNPRNGRFKRISPLPQLMDVHALLEDPDGRIWIGTEVGICSAEKDEMSFEERFVKGDGSISVFGLQRDALGRLWVGTLGDGLFVFREDGDLVAEFNTANGFCSDNINQIYCDHEGEFWIATYAGLVHFPDPTDLGRHEVFDGKNGLLNVNVRAVQEDAMGGIWVSTYDGISTLLRKERLFESYSFFNGVQIGSFVESSATRTPDGNLYFGSPEGVCYFSPRQMGASRSVSPLHFIDCWKNGSSYNEWVPLGADLSTEGIILGHKENTIRLEFAVEDFSQTERVEYSYRLPGVIDEWLSNGSSGRLFLWGLKSGKHQLQLRARLKDQIWEQGKTASLLIRVRPSVWGSWPARVVYGLLLAAILFFVFRYLRLRLSLRLEKEDRRKEQELGEERLRFFTNITHELRTPLTLILGPLEDLVHDKGLPEPYADRIAGIHRSGMRLHGLINQILEFRKTQTQTKRLVVREGDLGRLVESIGARYREMNQNTATEIRVDIRESFDRVCFDPDIVSTILENLLSNAVKYTPRGSVTLSLYGEEIDGERYCTMSVKDTGYGISESDLSQIFDCYYQVKGPHQASGTGIGLALVKALADVHKGMLRVTSREGMGSVFSFSILRDTTYPDAEHAEPSAPVIPGHELPSYDTGADGAATSTSQRLILVVEDDADILRYISSALSGKYAVVTATDGRKGYDIALDTIPDMIISDIMMPVMDGIELCRMIKSDIRTSHIPLILLTAKDSLQDKETGYESGADSYLTKPFTSRLLLSRIANIFEMRLRLADHLVKESSGAADTETATFEESLNDRDKEFIARFDRLIEENMDKEDLDMGFITASFNMSYSTFYRKVKGLLGISAKDFILHRKMCRAMELLRSGKYNVNEVSLAVGYQDTGNFRNYFRKVFGINPSEVLKKADSVLIKE